MKRKEDDRRQALEAKTAKKQQKAALRSSLQPFLTLMKLVNSEIKHFPVSKPCPIPKSGSMTDWL